MSSSAREAPAKSWRGAWALLLWTVFFLLTLFDVRLFLRGPFLTARIELLLAARSGDDFFIGDLEISGWNEVTARNAHVDLGGGDRIFLPAVRARFAREGGRSFRVEEVDLVSPVVLLGGRGPGGSPGGEPPSFPLERLTIRDGRLVVPSRYARAVGPLDAVLARVGGGKLRLQGSAALPPLPLPVRLDLVFDPADITGAAGSAALRDLQLNSLGIGLPFGGSVDIDLSLEGKADTQVLTAEGQVRNVSRGGFTAAPVFDGPFSFRAGLDSAGRVAGGGKIELTSQGSREQRHELEFSFLLAAGLKTLEKSEATLESPLLGRWQITGTAAVTGEGPVFDLQAGFREVDLASLRSAALPLPGVDRQPLTGGVCAGSLRLQRLPGEDLLISGSLTVSSPALPGGHPLAGWLPPVAEGDFRLRRDSTRERLAIEKLKTNAAAGLPLSLRGTVALGAGTPRQLDLRAALPWLPLRQLAGILEKRDFPFSLPAEAGGEAMASLHLQGSTAAPAWRGEALLRDGRFAGSGLVLRDLSAAASFSGEEASGGVDEVNVHAGSLRTGVGQGALSAEDVSLSLSHIEFDRGAPRGRAGISIASSRIRLEPSGAKLHDFEGLSLSLAAAFDGARNAISWKDLDLQGLPGATVTGGGVIRWSPEIEAETELDISFTKDFLDVTQPLVTASGAPHEIEGAGAISLAASLLPLPSGGREARVKAGLQLREGGFSSADGGKAVGGLDLGGSAEVVLAHPSGTGTWSAELQTQRFEALAGPYYLDLTATPVTAAASGSLDLPGRAVRAGRLAFALDEILSARWQRVPGAGGSASERLALTVEDGRRAYDLLVRDNFSETSPFLAGLEVEGTASLAADLERGDGSLAARGLLEVGVGRAGHGDGSFALEGGRLNLPFDFTTRGEAFAGLAAEAGDFGTLSLQGLRIGPVRFGTIAASPAVRKGSLIFDGTVALPLFDSTIVLEDLRWDDLASPARSLSLALGITDLDAGKLFETLSLPAVEGTATGRLDRILLRDGSLEADGRLDVSLFGGTLTFTEFSGRNLSGPVPSWGFSVEAAEMDLERLTEAFDFGRISGVAGGYARDVVIAAGQLQHFDAGFETARRRGVEQKISVEALEKISILGSGGRPDVFSRGVMQLFKEYNYASIGFSATLRNDRLSLDGIGGDGERTYLVKGGLLPPKANVISHSREISFGEIVERLARIGRVGREETE